MERLTAEKMRAISKVDFADKGFDAPEGDGVTDPLSLEIARAVAWLEWATGRVESEFLVSDSGEALLWEQANQLLVEQRIIHRTDDYVSSLHDNVNEISVTGYSEKKVSYKERKPFRQITYHNELDELLWMLMTDDKRAYWISTFTMAQVPVEVISYFDSTLDNETSYTPNGNMWPWS